MLGTIINTIAVLLGGALGSVFGDKIKEEYSRGIMTAMGFVVAAIGIQSAAGIKSFLVAVLSVAIGTFIGMLIRLDDKINGGADWVKDRLANTPLGKGPFGDAIVTCFMLFCVGSMTILGSIRAGLDHDYSILYTKSVMDCISSTAFGSAFGAGVMFAAFPVLLFQGLLTLLAGACRACPHPGCHQRDDCSRRADLSGHGLQYHRSRQGAFQGRRYAARYFPADPPGSAGEGRRTILNNTDFFNYCEETL